MTGGVPWRLEKTSCPLCGGGDSVRLGVRGNREHHGADPKASPHVWTYVVRCRRCDLIFTNPMIRGLEHLEQGYYGDPDAYQATAEGNPAAMFQHRLDFIEHFQRPGSLLDVGAGKGEFLAEACQRGWAVEGVEPSAPFCKRAAEIFSLRLRCGFLGQVEGLREGTFDVVTLNHVLEHVDRPLDLLRLCGRYARPGGLIFVEVPNADSYLLCLADLFFRFQGRGWSSRLSPVHPPFHCFAYTARSLRFALESSNWTVVALKTYSGRDRGFKGPESLAAKLRDTASAVLDWVGNRELLAAVARRPG